LTDYFYLAAGIFRNR